MKILHTVESYLPERHGMSEVVRQISERLVVMGHDVTVATAKHPLRTTDSIKGVRVASFSVSGKSASSIHGDIQSYQRFLMDSEADVIVNFAAQQWATDLIFPILPYIKAKKVFVPTGFSALQDAQFASYFENMKEWLRLYDACVFLSDDYRDINFAREAGIQNCTIIPNAAARDEFDRKPRQDFRARLGIPADDFLIIHVAGYLSVAKGQIEALQMFNASGIRNATLLMISGDFANSLFSSITPRKLARAVWHSVRGYGMAGFLPSWQIGMRKWVSRRRNKANSRRVLTVALSREDTIDAFLSSDLLLFPSWIECSPLVLFEAAAAATPFLVTDVGNAREIIRWTGGGRLLPGTRRQDREGSVVADTRAGAALLEEVWRDEEGRRHMGEMGQTAWRQNFTWEVIASRYEQLYRTLLRGEEIRGKFPPPPAVQPNKVS
jgi:L-malate glycosyltransferase